MIVGSDWTLTDRDLVIQIVTRLVRSLMRFSIRQMDLRIIIAKSMQFLSLSLYFVMMIVRQSLNLMLRSGE
ncbi:hypothetical protein HY29_18325 [Hyphomonas beringensis]|uniref:Uncharacterized protein n=1 Tax=Hyphomonas beringensis TaxID=1280946 RepID=A0A062U5B6_9PROT|nr:hypothetical protein HY29_18325 [Hyphomonas beringensis]